MHNLKLDTLQDIVPHVEDHLLPEIQQAIEVCRKAYWDDAAFNDMYTFGTQFWRNTWNRFKTVAEFDDCPFDLHGKGNEYKLKIGPFIMRHHRINNQSRLPSGAKAVKSSSSFIQMGLFNDDYNAPVEIDNVVLAIDADILRGLQEVFVGQIMPIGLNSNKFRWTEKALVFLADGVEASSGNIFQIDEMQESPYLVPEEKPAKVSLSLAKPKKIIRGGESIGGK